MKKVLPDKTSAYINIVSSLNETIGKLDEPVIAVIQAVEKSIYTCLNQFDRRFLERKQDRCEQIDFKLMVNSARLNANTIAFIADVAVNNLDCSGFSNEAYEAIAILTFISNLQVTAVHGTNANMGSVLHTETTNITPLLESCFLALDQLVDDINTIISSASFDRVERLKDYLRNYVETIHSYKDSWAELLGPFEGVNITVAEVNDNLAKTVPRVKIG